MSPSRPVSRCRNCRNVAELNSEVRCRVKSPKSSSPSEASFLADACLNSFQGTAPGFGNSSITLSSTHSGRKSSKTTWGNGSAARNRSRLASASAISDAAGRR